MADTKVELVVNDEKKNEVTVSEITSVEIRGATGVATYRLDPTQDVVIKLVVVGKVAPEGELPEAAPVTTEDVVGHFGTPENVKNLKDREKKVREDQEKAAKEAEEAAKPEREHVGKATISK
jgi:hypothetical protein